MTVYESLGLEWLLEDKTRESEVKRLCHEETRYIVPGFEYDYELHTSGCDLDFYHCVTANDASQGLDIQFCGDAVWQLKYLASLDTSSTSHTYRMTSITGDIVFPVRIVCPDVLADPQKGDLIKGQVVAFANPCDIRVIDASDDLANGEISETTDGTVKLRGIITHWHEHCFMLDGIESSFWEININTPIGGIPVLVKKAAIDKPENHRILIASGIISMDVTTIGRSQEEEEIKKYVSTDIPRQGKSAPYRNGLTPSLNSALRVLAKCVCNGDFSRFARCCAGNVDVIDTRGNSVRLSRLDTLAYLKASHGGAEHARIQHVIDSKDSRYIGHCVVSLLKCDACFAMIRPTVNEQGFVTQLAFLSPDEYSLGIDEELHLLSILADAMCNGKPDSLSNHLSRRCMYRSEYADVSVIGSERIIERLQSIKNRLDETNGYSYEIKLTADELSVSDDLPGIYDGKWCIKEYQAGAGLAAVVFIQHNYSQITNILLSRDGRYLKAFAKDLAERTFHIENNVDVRNLIGSVYGYENSIGAMRESPIPDCDTQDVYIWKEADEYAIDWSIKAFCGRFRSGECDAFILQRL